MVPLGRKVGGVNVGKRERRQRAAMSGIFGGGGGVCQLWLPFLGAKKIEIGFEEVEKKILAYKVRTIHLCFDNWPAAAVRRAYIQGSC